MKQERQRPAVRSRGLGVRSLLTVAVTLALGAFAGAGTGAAEDDWDDDWDEAESTIEVHGFVEGAAGVRVVDDPTSSDDFILSEARFRLDLAHTGERADVAIKGDFVHDDVTSESYLDLRQARVSLRPAGWLDAQVGRQVLTWGTGDLVFLNDLFPKDFVSFFVGRDEQFLKAPSDAFKFSFYSSVANLDLVWTPVFSPDLFITGERLSFYDPITGGRVGPDSPNTPISPLLPEKSIENGEFAGRLFRNLSGYEVAVYGYSGFFKQPIAFDRKAERSTFAPLTVVGASVRGNAFGGIFNAETAYYDSRDDRSGENPVIPNSEMRNLLGYERELVPSLGLGLQYYHEWTQSQEERLQNSPSPESVPDELRQLMTTRLTWRPGQQTWRLSLFAFVELGNGDLHLRPSVAKQLSDEVSISVGGNVMSGDQSQFFGQLENNSNLYARVRYSF